MADVTNEYEGGRNSLLSPALEAPPSSSGGSDGATQQDNFGDLLAALLRSLPTDASTLFIKSLSGLSTRESGELCSYVAQLKDEKQFRVIRAMAESTIDGKKKFLDNLRKKFALQREKEQQLQAQEELELEEHMKRKQALSAAARVKMLNGGAKQFHSMNAVLGAKENVASGGNSSLTAAALAARDVAPGVARSLSSSSVNVTKEDIRSVGKLLGDAHIGESEQNLRELEISKLAPSSSSSADAHMDQLSKRERPESSRALAQSEAKAQQRSRGEASVSSTTSSTTVPPPSSSASDSPSEAGRDDAGGEDPDAPTTKRWTKSQDAALRESVRLHGEKNWKAIAELVPGRNHAQCLQRWRKVLKPGLVKGHWSFEEDQVLEFLVTQGCNNWGQIAERIPGRTPKQCRERWKNHLDPAINKGPYTEAEDAVILQAQERLGNKWSQIAQLLKGRTEDSVKIRWKSLKQNPSKAAASHAQQKKNQAQAQAQAQAHMGYSVTNSAAQAALLRQRQLALLQQQQQLQQHSDAAQQLEQQQLRLQEKLLAHQQAQQAQQAQQHALPPHDDHLLVKDDVYARMPMALDQQQHAPQLYAGYTQGYTSYPDEYAASPAGYDAGFRYALHGGGHAGQYRSGADGGDAGEHGGAREGGGDAWDLQPDLTDGLGLSTRLGENPPPSSFWETYPKQPHLGAAEPLPLALQSMLQDPNRTPTAGSHPHHYGAPDDEFNDAMFEKLATEFGSQDMHFGPI